MGKKKMLMAGGKRYNNIEATLLQERDFSSFMSLPVVGFAAAGDLSRLIVTDNAPNGIYEMLMPINGDLDSITTYVSKGSYGVNSWSCCYSWDGWKFFVSRGTGFIYQGALINQWEIPKSTTYSLTPTLLDGVPNGAKYVQNAKGEVLYFGDSRYVEIILTDGTIAGATPTTYSPISRGYDFMFVNKGASAISLVNSALQLVTLGAPYDLEAAGDELENSTPIAFADTCAYSHGNDNLIFTLNHTTGVIRKYELKFS